MGELRDRARHHTEVREALLAVVLELLLREVLVEIAVRVIHAPGEGKEDRGSKTSPQGRKSKSKCNEDVVLCHTLQ